MPDFLPRREGELLGWVSNFVRRAAADRAAIRLSNRGVAELVAAQGAYVAAAAVVASPRTRSPMNIAWRDEARAEVVRQVRAVARQARGLLGAEGLLLLGLRVGGSVGGGDADGGGGTAGPSRRRRIGPPRTAPVLSSLGFVGPRLRLILSDAESPARVAKPAGVVGAIVWARVEGVAAGGLPGGAAGAGGGWVYAGNPTRTRWDAPLPAAAALGSHLWVRAAWLNPRRELGPMSRELRVTVTALIADPDAPALVA